MDELSQQSFFFFFFKKKLVWQIRQQHLFPKICLPVAVKIPNTETSAHFLPADLKAVQQFSLIVSSYYAVKIRKKCCRYKMFFGVQQQRPNVWI